MKELKIDFDGNWKEIIIEFFEDFVAFFMPKLYPYVDFSRPPEILEQELIQVLEAIGSDSKKVADKLLKVWLKDGTEKWILVHIEIQSYFEKLFSKRMYQIFSMIFHKYDHKIVAIAIYTNTKTPRFYNRFMEDNFGTSVIYRFIGYRIMRQKESDLLASNNIFSLFVLANYYVNKTRKDLRKRLELKEKMLELAKERQISPERMGRFFFFIDNVMKIPLNLQQEFKGFIFSKYKIPTDMPSALYKNRQEWYDFFTKEVYKPAVDALLEEEREKAREKTQKIILKFSTEMKWSNRQIAAALEIPLKEVEQIIAAHAAN